MPWRAGTPWSRRPPRRTLVIAVLFGVQLVVAGIFRFVAALALLLGILWIINGAVEVFTALSHRGMQGRGWTIVMELVLACRLRSAGQAATRMATAT